MQKLIKEKTDIVIYIALGWHALVVVAGLGTALFFLQMPAADYDLSLRWVAIVLSAIMGLLSIPTIYLLYHRRPLGRIFSLAINYIGFILTLLVSFQLLGVFLGIDFIAGTFGRGVIFLVGVFCGYLIHTLGDRYPHDYQKEMRFRRIGKGVMLAFGLIFLIRVDFFPWLLSILAQLGEPLKLGLVVAAAIFGLFSWVMAQEEMGVICDSTNAQTEAISGYLFLSPNLLGFLLFFAAPLLLSFYTSFTDWDAFGTRNWIGLDNYRTIFTLDIQPLAYRTQPVTEVLDVANYDELTRLTIFGNHYIIGASDKLFWIALRNTIVFCLAAVPLSVIPALFLANVLNSKIPGIKFFRALYFLPSIAAVVGVALIWQWLYNAAIGYINYFITLGINVLNLLPGLALVDPQIRWLSDSNTALLAIIIMSAWQTMGFNSVLFLAGLQNIPGELYEAATVDGAGVWARFFKITLPMLAPTTFFVVSTTTIQALQVFEQVFIATNPPGGPNNATLTVVLYLYQNGFQRFKQGYASATAWVLFGVIFLVTLMQFQRQRASEAAYE